VISGDLVVIGIGIACDHDRAVIKRDYGIDEIGTASAKIFTPLYRK